MINIEWNCGCKTWREGETFYIMPCSKQYEVYQIAMEESEKRGNIVIERELR